MRLAVFTFIFLTSNLSLAWEVKNFTGQVKAKNGLQMYEIKKGLKLPNGTRIITGEDGKIRVQDGSTVIKVGASTQLTLPPVGEKITTTITLDSGRIRGSFNPRKNQKLQVKTNTALVGVNATEIYMYSDSERDIIGNLKGKLEVSIDKTNEKFSVKAGKGLYLLPLAMPKIIENEKGKVKTWNKDTEI